MKIDEFAAKFAGPASVVKAAVATAAKAITARAVPGPRSRDARDELRRREEINARGDAQRAELEAELFGRSRWLGRRTSGWLKRGR